MKIIITGGCGFLGSNLARKSIEDGLDVLIIDNLSRNGSKLNLSWLRSVGDFKFHQFDISNSLKIEEIVKLFKPDIIYHLAGQVAMTSSIADPLSDLNTNVIGTFNILESLRKYSKDTILIYSSTNKVYGDLFQFKYLESDTRYICEEHPVGFSEDVGLNFHSPYGCSKGAADQYILDYSRIFGIRAVVFRHSSMYGCRQFSTERQGWIGWFIYQAVRYKNKQIDSILISGNGKQVRDLLHSEDMISLYLSAINNIDKASGEAFNIGGGYRNSLSIIELFNWLENYMNISIKYTNNGARISDQLVFIANLKKAKLLLNWEPMMSKEEGLIKMVNWVSKN
jgi:CDP-paratose 2-epimerase